MLRILRPLYDVGTLKGWLYASLGALGGSAVGMLALPVGLVAVLMTPGPPLVRASVLLVVVTVMLGVLGFPLTVRAGAVRLANALLGTAFPTPSTALRNRWPDRWRTGAWLILHAAGGIALLGVTGFLLMMGLAPATIWLLGGGQLEYVLFTMTVPSDVGGAWVLAIAAGYLLLIGYLGAAAAALFRVTAPVFLDQSAADRLAAMARTADDLAHRNRLARELHDSIGHTLTASTIHAAAAGRLLDTDPDSARQAMSSIEETSRTALEDLDHVLGVLRDNGGRAAPTAPRRTLADVEELLEPVRRAGADLTVVTSGNLARVPASVSAEAYRIVQEGLTNALRHAGPVPITLRLATGADRLAIELTNPMPAAGSPGSARAGHGLAGIAERVGVLRGESTAGPDTTGPDASWRLTVWLPIPSAP